jgi:hypothetical protein
MDTLITPAQYFRPTALPPEILDEIFQYLVNDCYYCTSGTYFTLAGISGQWHAILRRHYYRRVTLSWFDTVRSLSHLARADSHIRHAVKELENSDVYPSNDVLALPVLPNLTSLHLHRVDCFSNLEIFLCSFPALETVRLANRASHFFPPQQLALSPPVRLVYLKRSF